jgi:hypothetical protein
MLAAVTARYPAEVAFQPRPTRLAKPWARHSFFGRFALLLLPEQHRLSAGKLGNGGNEKWQK